MSESKKTVLCIFCNERGPLSREDVTSNWIGRTLGKEPGGTWINTAGKISGGDKPVTKQTQHKTASVFKVPVVCVDCNTQWMSRLDNAVRPSLGPMIVGRVPGHLTREQLDLLAAWALMKAIVYDAMDRRALPPEVGHRFFVGRTPEPADLVLLGRWEAPAEHPTRQILMKWVTYWDHLGVVEAVRAVILVFTFGQALLQVGIPVTPPPEGMIPEHPPPGDDLILCWPPREGSAVWPPPLPITERWRGWPVRF